MVALQQTSLNRASEEPIVRTFKKLLEGGPDYANHFAQLQRWLPIKAGDPIDDRALAEFNTDTWNLQDLERNLRIETPQLPAAVRSTCVHLSELIAKAR